MKIIFGILASTNENYSQFIDIWVNNIQRFKSGPNKDLIDFYFIFTEPNIKKSIEINSSYYKYYSEYKENVSMMDSFINRTISLLDYLKTFDLLGDYFIRTNLSTLFDLEMFSQFVKLLPKNNIIAGSVIDNVNSLYTYISGTNILLSRNLVEFLILNKKHILDESILSGDDQRISSLIIENLDVTLLLIKRLDFIEIENVITPSILFQSCDNTNNLFCYRFKTTDRNNDIKIMQLLQSKMYNNDFNIIQFISSLIDDPNISYKEVSVQNKNYDELTYTLFKIQVNSNLIDKYNRYKQVQFECPPNFNLKLLI